MWSFSKSDIRFIRLTNFRESIYPMPEHTWSLSSLQLVLVVSTHKECYIYTYYFQILIECPFFASTCSVWRLTLSFIADLAISYIFIVWLWSVVKTNTPFFFETSQGTFSFRMDSMTRYYNCSCQWTTWRILKYYIKSYTYSLIPWLSHSQGLHACMCGDSDWDLLNHDFTHAYCTYSGQIIK
jgi:hypothetical protein